VKPGSIVIVHLADPNEKYWGVLESIAAHGLTLRCLNVESFDDWTRSITSEEAPSLGLATIFFPMRRLERMFLDERVGVVESMQDHFTRQVGKTVEAYLREIGVIEEREGV
jgi:hypothetical protein